MTRYFWTLFFIGSLFAIAFDVSDRRQSTSTQSQGLGDARTLETDPYSGPTPRP